MNTLIALNKHKDMYSFVSWSANRKGDCYLRACLSIVAMVHLVTQKVKAPLHLLAAFLSHFLNKEGRFIPPDV